MMITVSQKRRSIGSGATAAKSGELCLFARRESEESQHSLYTGRKMKSFLEPTK